MVRCVSTISHFMRILLYAQQNDTMSPIRIPIANKAEEAQYWMIPILIRLLVQL